MLIIRLLTLPVSSIATSLISITKSIITLLNSKLRQASGLPNQTIKRIVKLLESTTAGVSRGVPVGPHGIHLIAESTLIPIDNNLVQVGIDFIRYADDMIVFAEDEKIRPISVLEDRRYSRQKTCSKRCRSTRQDFMGRASFSNFVSR